MKRQILTFATVMTLAFAGAALAQEPTTPTTTTANPNATPGYAAPAPMTPAPAEEPEMQTDQTMGTTDTVTAQPSAVGRTDDQNDTMNSPEPAVAPSAVVPETGTPEVLESNREMDTTTTGTTSTTATGTTGTTAYDSTASTDTAADMDTLPSTASDLPSLLLIGLLALGAAFGIHAYSTRRA